MSFQKAAIALSFEVQAWVGLAANAENVAVAQASIQRLLLCRLHGLTHCDSMTGRRMRVSEVPTLLKGSLCQRAQETLNLSRKFYSPAQAYNALASSVLSLRGLLEAYFTRSRSSRRCGVYIKNYIKNSL